MDLGLRNQRVVLTGATAGIGLATARLLAAEGARQLLVARSAADLDRVAAELEAATGTAPEALAVDVTAPGAADRIAATALDRLGGVEVLINNAGRSDTPGQARTEEVWQASMELNFHAKRRLTEALLPGMIAAGYGRIVTLIGSMEPLGESAAFPAVAAARVWAKGLSRTIAAHGITINCVSPGRVLSWQTERNHPVAERQDIIDRLIPAGRFGDPEEVAAVIAFLASRPASYVTGETIHVDGGLHRQA